MFKMKMICKVISKIDNWTYYYIHRDYRLKNNLKILKLVIQVT